MLRSTVGMAHIMRSGLVMGYTTSYFPLIMLGYHSDSNRSYGPLSDTLGFTQLNQLPIKIGSFQFLPTGLHGLCFGCGFSGPLPLRSLANGPPIVVCFRESLFVRLHSEIDQIHLSIEAQCVTTRLPLGDCHNWLLITWLTVFFLFTFKKGSVNRTEKCFYKVSHLENVKRLTVGYWQIFE